MKIISKFKDYYDYLQGIWGVDELRVLDRTEFTPRTINDVPFKKGELITLYVCDLKVQGIYDGTKFLYGEDLKPFEVEETNKYRWWDKDYNERDYITIKLDEELPTVSVLKKPTKVKDSPNRKLNCPILKPRIQDVYQAQDYLKHPVLKDYNFGSAIPPEDIWLLLSDWLGQEKVIPNKQTDKEKILSAGFDLKSSFRKEKQK